jgi:hypothetical protein
MGLTVRSRWKPARRAGFLTHRSFSNSSNRPRERAALGRSKTSPTSSAAKPALGAQIFFIKPSHRPQPSSCALVLSGLV